MNTDKKSTPYLNSFIKILKGSNKIAIGTHINPDCDGICAALGCAALVQHYKKRRPVLFCYSPIPPKYDFLLKKYRFNTSLDNFDTLIVVDSASIERVFPAPLEKSFPKLNTKTVINIDHHKSNNLFGNLAIIDESASSSCEIIFRLFKKLKIKISPTVAGILYSGIYMETGGFVYQNTTEKALTIAAELVRLRVNPTALVKKLNAKNLAGTLLLSKVLSTIKVRNGVGFMYVNQKMVQEHRADITDCENFISFLQAIREVRVSVFFREEKDGTRISLRSDGILDVDKLAQKFGGGGHRLAAGIKMKKSLNQARKEILQAINRELKKRD